ncbi:hypothetical protein [Flexithrix dorotheae]|uniref:hypothetical protein n=1 Tax=Flexithrix dorotheae TaxID=70993 RepID=UPI000375F81A|nr:hypothetical protein [Flexithrix dorotheae]
MILLEMDGLLPMIIFALVVMYSPGIILLLIGWRRLVKKKKDAKVYFILGALYFLVGIGICFSL